NVARKALKTTSTIGLPGRRPCPRARRHRDDPRREPTAVAYGGLRGAGRPLSSREPEDRPGAARCAKRFLADYHERRPTTRCRRALLVVLPDQPPSPLNRLRGGPVSWHYPDTHTDVGNAVTRQNLRRTRASPRQHTPPYR